MLLEGGAGVVVGSGTTVAGPKTAVVESEVAVVGSKGAMAEPGVVIAGPVLAIMGPAVAVVRSAVAVVRSEVAMIGAIGVSASLSLAGGRKCCTLDSDRIGSEILNEGEMEALASLLAVPCRIARTWLAPRLCAIAKAAARAASAVRGSVPVSLTGVKYFAGCPPTFGPDAVRSGTTPPGYMLGSTTMRCVTQPSGSCV